MKKLSMILTVLIIFGTSAIGHTSDERVVFEGIFKRGNDISTRAIGSKGAGNKGNGTPVSQFKNFSGMSGEATLKVCDVAEAEKISSATIAINENIVVGSSNFNQNVGCIEKTVSLNKGDNILEVLLKSKPGGEVSVEILQLQPDIPPSSDVCDGDGTYPNTWIETIYVGKGNPFGISVSHDGEYVYVTHPLSDTVSVIPTSENNPVIEPITVGKLGSGISASPVGEYVYVTHLDGWLSVISISDNNNYNVLKTIFLGNKPWGVSVSSNGEYVYVSHYDTDGTVSVISTSEILKSDNPVIETMKAGTFHRGVSVSPDGSYVYVSNSVLKGTVSAIPISGNNTEIETINVGENPTGISVSPDGKYVYVSNLDDSTVSVISICDNNTLIDTIAVGENPINLQKPAGVSVSPNGDYVYVTDYVPGGKVSVFGFKFDDQIMDSF